MTAERLLSWLVKPSPGVTDPGDRRHAELLAGMLVVFLPLSGLSSTIHLALDPEFGPIYVRVAAAMALQGLGYGLARTRAWRLGAVVASSVPPLVCAMIAAVDADEPTWLAFPVLGVVMAGALLEPTKTAIAAAANLLIVVAALWTLPGLQVPRVVIPVLTFHVAVSAVVVLAGWHRERVERARQEERERTQRLELLGLATGGVAHDFNNLLMVLLGVAESRIDSGDRSPEMQQIRDTCLRAASFVAQLTHPEQAPRCDPAAVVLDMAPLLGTLAGRQIQLEIEARAGQAQVPMSAAHLQQVVMNLVVNARQAMPHGGTIRVVVRNASQGACLEVIDEGTGIPAELRARIFEPFFTTRPTGTGLGLSTVQLLVQQAGGNVSAHGEVGEGAHFRVMLPLLAAGGSPPRLESLPGGGA